MDEFILPLECNGKEYELKGRFVRIGYVHQFHISVEDRTLIFEYDEERNYRIIDPTNSSKPMDKEFLEAIVAKISSLHD